ncbi:MAG: polysulfide reductase NrfD [Actinobacteria bacterium]|nr:polysulfide reductase NrfD [Actinomycetota bacterium]
MSGPEEFRGSAGAPSSSGSTLIEPREDIREAAMRPVMDRSRWWKLVVAGLSAIVLLGIVAWAVQLADGLGVSGYNNRAFWAVYEADLVAFIGVSYGGAVVSAILRLTKASWRAPLTRIAEATALVTLPIGMLFIVPHLGEPSRIWELVWPPYWNLSSPILWDFIAVSTYLLATTVFFYLPLIPDAKIALERINPEDRTLKARTLRALYRSVAGRYSGSYSDRRLLHGSIGLVAIMIIPMAVSVHSVLSFAFASSSRAGYLETIFPVYFVVAALYSGVALVVISVALLRKAYHLEKYITPRHFVRLGFIIAAMGAAYLYLTFTEYLVDGYSSTRDEAAWVRQILIGRYWIPFWFYFVAAGVLPLVVIAFKRFRNTKGIVVASSFIIFAMWVKRLVIVIPPATEALVKSPLKVATATGAGRLATSASAWGTYHFTWVPISITLAATAAIPLLLLVLFKFVPILPISEMEEMAEVDEVIETAQIAMERPGSWRGKKVALGHRGVSIAHAGAQMQTRRNEQ